MKRDINQNVSLICLGVILMWIGFDPNLTPWGDSLPFFHAMAHVVLFIGSLIFFLGIESIRRIAVASHSH